MKILVLYDGAFPYGNAMSSRIRSFCRIFSELNADVHVICASSGTKRGNKQERRLERCTFTIAPKGKGTIKEKLFGNPKYFQTVKEYIVQNKPDFVFSTSGKEYFYKLVEVCKYYQIPLFIEQCEWLDISEFIFRYLDPRYIRMNRLIQGGYKKATGIIAISSSFEKHYRNMGVDTVRVPTILDVINSPCRVTANEGKIVLVFTGSIARGKKELIAPIINVLRDNLEIRSNVEFHIYGENKDAIETNIGYKIPKLLENCVFVHGRVPQEEIQDIVINADYQIFIRPQRRSSNFGFSTKLGESMSVGTPVITNNTSDIGMYIKSGDNGFLINNSEERELVQVLRAAIEMSKEERTEMRKRTRKAAEIAFDYREYKNTIKGLFGIE